MKKHYLIVVTLFVMLLILGAASVDAASLDGTVANFPWSAQMFKDSEDGVVNLSTGFVGPYQVPLLSYNRAGQHYIYQAFKATSAVTGNCGPGNTWYCDSWHDSALVPGTVSNMASVQYIDSHAIRWVYSTGSTIRGVYLELLNNMSFLDADWQDLLQISKFGASVIGAPSIRITSGGHYEMAVTILGSGDLYPYSLVYMKYVGGSNTSCLNSGSPYQCVVVDTSLGYGSMGTPSLDLPEATAFVGIAYYLGGEMMFAYPHESQMGWPSNCGEAGNPWRCITIFSGTPTGTVGNVAKLAFGETSSDRSIAFTYDDELIPVTLYNARYVGSGGNCGMDSRFGGFTDYRFECDDIIYFYYQTSPSFSLEIDPEGYPVIAYNYADEDLANRDLYIVYPRARIGDPTPGWLAQHIDGAPVQGVYNGAQAALALSNSGMGFISYLQEEDYEIDDLKIALQQFQAMLPIITKP